jgi:2-iminobutanoate/2-iminopropanoate deaminase
MTRSRALEHQPVFSWSRTHGGLIYTSGHAAVDVETLERRPGSFQAEVRESLTNLKRTLEAAGSSMDRVLKITVYVTDLGQFAELNRIYREFFPGPNPPARTCVEVRRLPYNFTVEIEAVAHA